MATISELFVSLKLSAENFNNGLRQAQREAKEFEKSVSPISKTMKDVGAAMTAAGATLTTALTAPLVALGALSTKAGIEFESSFAGVRKTVDATEAEFKVLSDGLRAMAQDIPVSVNALNAVGEAAGQLGIKKENILQFTRTMADLGVTTNLTADQAATATAQIQNIFGAAGQDVDRFGATLVALGNAGASTEKDIIDMGLRIAGAGNQIGLTQAQVLGFASALSSVGINAEAGGSAISRVFLKINDAVMSGGASLELFAKVAGTTTAQFKQSFEQDAAGATVAFISGIGRMKDEGKNVNATLEELVGKNIILKDTLLRASGAGTLLADQLKIGNDAWRENTALTNEAAERYKTTESQLLILKNRLNDVGITLFESLGPVLRDVIVPTFDKFVDAIKFVADAFKSLPTPIQGYIVALAGIAAAAGPVLLGAGLLTTQLGGLIPVFARLIPVISGAGGFTAALGGAATALGVIPTLAAVAATALASVGVGLAIRELFGFGEALDSIAEKLGAAGEGEGHRQLAIATRQLSDNLAAQGIIIERGTDSIEQWNERVLAAAKSSDKYKDALGNQTIAQINNKAAHLEVINVLKEIQAKQDAAAAAANKAREASEKEAEAIKKFKDEVDKAKDAILGIDDKARSFTTALHELDSQGKLTAAVILENKNRILDLDAANDKLVTRLQSMIPVLESVRNAYQEDLALQDAIAKSAQDLADIKIPNLNAAWDSMDGPPDAINDELATLVRGVEAINTAQRLGLEEDARRFEAMKAKSAAATAALKADVEQMKNAGGEIFDALVMKGENVFTSLGTALKGGALSLGRAVFEDISGALLGPIKNAFDNFFQGLLESSGIKGFVEGLGKKLGSMLGGIFDFGGGGVTSDAAGGAGGGGGAAGSISSIASGGWSNIIGGAIGGAMSLLGSARLEGTMNAVESNTRGVNINLEHTMNQILWPMHGDTQRISEYTEPIKYLAPIIEATGFSIRMAIENLGKGGVLDIQAIMEEFQAGIRNLVADGPVTRASTSITQSTNQITQSTQKAMTAAEFFRAIAAGIFTDEAESLRAIEELKRQLKIEEMEREQQQADARRAQHEAEVNRALTAAESFRMIAEGAFNGAANAAERMAQTAADSFRNIADGLYTTAPPLNPPETVIEDSMWAYLENLYGQGMGVAAPSGQNPIYGITPTGGSITGLSGYVPQYTGANPTGSREPAAAPMVNVNVTVEGSVTTENDLAVAIKDKIVDMIDYGGVRFPATETI